LEYQDDGTVMPDAAENLVRFDISTAPETRTEMLRELHRMNMSTATIYPGIQGFARSLENLLVFPDILEYGPSYDKDFLL
jgi:hypothetical protein